MIDNTSQYLYKYYSSCKYVKDVIKNKRVYLNNAKNFNDVFDSTVATNELLRFIPLDKSIISYIIQISHTNCKDYVKNVLQDINIVGKTVHSLFGCCGELLLIDKKEQEYLYHQLLSKYQNEQAKWKITCFSEKSDSLLMWAHYARNLRGFCLRFDTSKDINLTTNLKKVNYSQSRYEAVDFGLYFSKSSEWKYELEWRYITDTSDDYLATSACDAIIIGERCRYKKALETVAKNHGLLVFYAISDLKEYKIKIEEKNNE